MVSCLNGLGIPSEKNDYQDMSENMATNKSILKQ